MIDTTTASDSELIDAMKSESRPEILSEIERRVATRKKTFQDSSPFNPRVDISADAKYLWKRMFLWFWIIPAAAGLLWFAAVHI